MPMASFSPLFLLCFLYFFSAVKSDELQILLNLKTSLQNSHTNVFDSWDSTNFICDFTGITCTSDNSVKEIELSSRNLSGVLPLDRVCNLQSLEKLSLGFNSLSGVISVDLNKCTKLQYLDLGNNLFSGPFPEFPALSQLQHLFLNQSGFSGVFPWKSLDNITDLVTLSVGDNLFDPTPFPPQIVKLTKLNWLYLSNCSISGTIPQGIRNLSELINFEASDNNLSGEIPSEIGMLKNLWQLELYNNSLTGELPFGLRNLTKLENFDASMNNLKGNLSELRFLTNLVSLQLFYNGLSGEIPAEFGLFKKLVNLSLYGNKLTGPLPQQIGSWAKFHFVDVSENFLTGTIPPNMCKQGTMQQLLMLQNNLTGEIPASYASCKTLKRFRVSKNSLSGTVPAGIWGLPDVNIIDVEENQLEGPVTLDIGNAKALGQLFLGNNRLSGELPEEISEATSLVSIKLNDNQFSGKIPQNIGELKHLSSLNLQNNMFSGSIPESLGTCDSLTDINIAYNSLSGEIPSSLGSLPSLNSLNLSENHLSGEIPDSLSSLRLSLLDLTNNRLTGRIPQSLSIEAYNGSFAGNSGLCSQTVSTFQRCKPQSGMSKEVRTLIACFIVGAAILVMSLVYSLHLKKKEKDHDRSLKEESWDVKSFHVLTFGEDEILDSIKEENVIGKGGSGNVYRVSLGNGKELAVKHIWNTDSGGRKKSWSTTPMLAKGRGKSKEFDAEVQTLSSIRHVNVVKLYCSITSEDSSLLVYEYMPNGSLWDRLHTSKKMELDWETRYEIAVGAAKGLEYLHHGCDRPIIHRDVKSSNILLDELLKPRIADFGLAKIKADGGKDSTQVIAGTHGYIAPEYGYTYKVNEKSDVYSFGVVLMELVSGKRPIEPEYGDNKDIVDWISSNLKSKERVLSIVDSRIPEVFREDAVKVLRIAILCTARLPTLRPTMRSVVQMLEDAEPCKLVGIVISKDGASKKKEATDEE
ncbi:receptor-like protein kinase 7 [Ricinus communis]|uniref:non-specific serine/threonine protein kinase n=1 Tax=Ricinus communis TaxID=3988 RepID=B9R6R4_RICCO|nr:receptor-like protein kinase 7 [Ricinus communis]EEF52194.1 Receptor protein kinase CLAVATA1 precursor, putative [Ricinus communis]|eukprot:XP_002510007.1 receptor-like protein kinase HAIKU2 [Ricinus communis]